MWIKKCWQTTIDTPPSHKEGEAKNVIYKDDAVSNFDEDELFLWCGWPTKGV